MLKEDVKFEKIYCCLSHWDSDGIERVKCIEIYEDYCKVQSLTFGGSWNVRLSDIFETEQAAKNEIVRRAELKKIEIANGIHSVEDLLRMMFEAMSNAEEYTDYERLAVAKEKAKELLGIELE